MPNPNRQDQPAEGGRETVERALQKQSELKPDDKPQAGTRSGAKSRDKKTDKSR